MHYVRTLHPGALLLACALASPPASGACTVERLAELPVTMRGLRPLMRAAINGEELLFLADSGAFYSSLTPATAARLHLPVQRAEYGVAVTGVGGAVRPSLTRVKEFDLLDVKMHEVEFLVLGPEGGGVSGIIGQNLFRRHDVEFDLAHAAIRLFRAKDCEHMSFAYWAKAAGQPVSQLDLEAQAGDPHTQSFGWVNGERMRVLFDTGAAVSMLTLEAARRAGITPASPGVTPAGSGRGIGPSAVRTWIAPVASFRIGDEEVKNTRLRIAEDAMGSPLLHIDMLLGADFFLSHRIFVANSQRKLYFTYNGGPVFNLNAVPAHSGAAPESPAAAADAAPAAPRSEIEREQPADAASYGRRASARAARHDYVNAIADLTRASELAPAEPEYVYQRGVAHLQNSEHDLALADFDHALKLDPDYVPALLTRTQLHIQQHASAATVAADFEAADRMAAKDGDVHMRMADLCQHVGDYADAVNEYSKWIDAHPSENARMSRALRERCWARAQWGKQLDQAMSDCAAALSINPKATGPYDSEGMIYLRRSDYGRAIAAYDLAVGLQTRSPWVFYGRGIAKLRQGHKAEGEADLRAATALDPAIAEKARLIGVGP